VGVLMSDSSWPRDIVFLEKGMISGIFGDAVTAIEQTAEEGAATTRLSRTALAIKAEHCRRLQLAAAYARVYCGADTDDVVQALAAAHSDPAALQLALDLIGKLPPDDRARLAHAMTAALRAPPG
jgi:uncharacterized membrane protein